MQSKFKTYAQRLLQRAVSARLRAHAALRHNEQMRALHNARRQARLQARIAEVLHGELPKRRAA